MACQRHTSMGTTDADSRPGQLAQRAACSARTAADYATASHQASKGLQLTERTMCSQAVPLPVAHTKPLFAGLYNAGWPPPSRSHTGPMATSNASTMAMEVPAWLRPVYGATHVASCEAEEAGQAGCR